MSSRANRTVSIATWSTRIAFALVFFVNVQCALQFVLIPQDFVAAYELSGVAGTVAIQGMGVAFLMWNVTYPVVIVDPVRFRIVGLIVLVQQLVGLIGETCILVNIPLGHEVLISSIMRFIAFDATGLVIMAATLLALWACLQRN